MISDCLIENILDLSEKDYSISRIKEEIFNLKNNPINFVYLGKQQYLPIYQLYNVPNPHLSREILFF